METLFKEAENSLHLFLQPFTTAQELFKGYAKYQNDFLTPYLTSLVYFGRAELEKMDAHSFEERWDAYWDLLSFNVDLWSRCFTGSIKAWDDFSNTEIENCLAAFFNTVSFEGCKNGNTLEAFFIRQSDMISGVSQALPRAIKEIEPEYGFHFEQGLHPVVAETERFILYRVTPSEKGMAPKSSGKPVLIIPPFVLGSNILSFLPKEQKSYAHCFANQGIPTYIRVMKEIHSSPAVQTMTLEDDTLDTRYFCETLLAAHGKKITLNGYCQGGFSAVCNILSDKLDQVVDALITCVAPMDGTRSGKLGAFLRGLPPRFNDLIYGTKTLPNGNQVADGHLMGWVYKLKSIEDNAPLVSFLRDMFMVAHMERQSKPINKTVAAINYWLQNERTDIPLAITRMSFDSYNIPVTRDGTLPVTVFGRKLNFKGISEKKIPWLLCYGEDDDLVEKETALAPLDYVDVETTPFPKGHVAIATSWSHPESACGLHTRFGPEQRYRGPVRFHLDLEEEMDRLTMQEQSPPPEAEKKEKALAKAQPRAERTEKPEKKPAKPAGTGTGQTATQAPKKAPPIKKATKKAVKTVKKTDTGKKKKAPASPKKASATGKPQKKI